jgi:hypothetical protein
MEAEEGLILAHLAGALADSEHHASRLNAICVPPGVNPMKRLRCYFPFLLAPALALAVALIGCSSNNKDKSSTDGDDKDGDKAEPKKPLDDKGRGTLKGKVTLAGAKPNTGNLDKELMAKIKAHTDKEKCLAAEDKDETTDPSWRIDEEGGGVKNVFVWLKPPKGYYFKLNDDDIKPFKDKTITLKQPHCAFIPHCFTVFPSYFDGKGQKPTGEKVIVTNTASFQHNTKWKNGPSQSDDWTIPSKSEKKFPLLKITGTEINIGCSMHTWMNAYAWAFDHPFAALTDEHGNYEIKKVPAGVDLQVVAWHEQGKFAKEGGRDGVKTKLKKESTQDFTIEAP